MKYEYHLDKSKFLSTKFVKPKINIKIINGDRNLWGIFKKHHYLSEELPLATRCFYALCMRVILERNGESVGQF